jgi:hypothetical protein
VVPVDVVVVVLLVVVVVLAPPVEAVSGSVVALGSPESI